MFSEFQGPGNDMKLPSNAFNYFVKSSIQCFSGLEQKLREKTEFTLQLNSEPICQEMDLFYDGAPGPHLLSEIEI